jgi:hypothetical protein
MLRTFLGMLVLLLLVGPVSAEEQAAADEERRLPDLIPPVGVFGELVHSKGEIMLSYRYHRDSLDGVLIGSIEIAPPLLTGAYASVPFEMASNTHVFEVMWVPLEEITFVLSLPFLDKEMRQIDSITGFSYSTSASGFGDLGLSLLYRVFEDHRSRVHLNLGLTVPTGSINESSTTPHAPTQLTRLPYDMQLGSGTVDLIAGFTYNGFWRGLAWGTQMTGRLHAGTNDNGYKQGNEYDLTAWFGRRWLPWLNTAFRLDWRHWFNPIGQDYLLDPTFSFANDAGKQGGRRLDALFSVDFLVTGGALRGTKFGVEAGFPAYQYLDGPQLRTKWVLTAGAAYAF